MATIFLPLTAMASVFGMNLKSGLEHAPPWMFWAIMFGSIVAGLLVSELLAVFKLRCQSQDKPLPQKII
jgi:Mg2+ and Co2+ transporter CorA